MRGHYPAPPNVQHGATKRAEPPLAGRRWRFKGAAKGDANPAGLFRRACKLGGMHRRIVPKPLQVATPAGPSLADAAARRDAPHEHAARDAIVQEHRHLGFKRFARRSRRRVVDWKGRWTALAGQRSSASGFSIASAGSNGCQSRMPAAARDRRQHALRHFLRQGSVSGTRPVRAGRDETAMERRPARLRGCPLPVAMTLAAPRHCTARSARPPTGAI